VAFRHPANQTDHRYVDIPCPSGKHQRTLVTFRDHTVAAMFCVPCEYAWTEATTHPALFAMPIDKERIQGD
jgi:hypothetical protein